MRVPIRRRFQLDRQRSGNLKNWVSIPGSMTRAVADACHQQPQVELRYQGPDRASRWEAVLIGKTSGCRVHAREISLTIAGNPVLLARSITPTGGAVEPLLRGLGNKPLAELLFTDPRWQRHQPPAILAGSNDGQLPGRVCVWDYDGRRSGILLVAEYFLPELLALTPG